MTLEIRPPGGLAQPPEPWRDRARQHLVATRTAAVAVTRRRAWSAWRVARQLPRAVCLLVRWSPRGLWRLLVMWGAYLRDEVSDELRSHHARERQAVDYDRVSARRGANLRARLRTNALIVAPVLALVLAWTAPDVLAIFVGVGVAAAVIRVLPWRQWAHELALAAGAGLGAWAATPWAASFIPRPPEWLAWTAAAAGVLGCGWAGRPRARPLVTVDFGEEYGHPQKPSANMVVDALIRSGVKGMTLTNAERVHAETRVIAPGVATSAHGYVVELELPPGITVDEVVARRAPLAAALRRDLSMVWPSGNPERHPGYLRLFLSHKPMNKARQPAWPVAAGKPLNYFGPIPMFTDEQMRWVDLQLAGTHMAMGGASGSGKSVGLRQLGVALAFTQARLIVFDGKRSGDLNPIRDLCGDDFYEGAEPEDAEQQLECLRWLVAERERRARFLASLPREENRQSKVTEELAARYPDQLRPIVALFDEVQEYTEYGVKGNTEDKRIRDEFVALLTKLSRLARAAGISLVFVSQKPDAQVLPSAIMGNCGIRVAFRVLEQVHNDQILGTSARKNGVDATMFTLQDRGIAWVRGGESADTMVARTWSPMVDLDEADELVAKARALRKAAGLLPADDVEDAEVVLDVSADVREVLARRGTHAAHLAELVEWLPELRPEYAMLSVGELGRRLRDDGWTVGQTWARGRNREGVDLRKQEKSS